MDASFSPAVVRLRKDTVRSFAGRRGSGILVLEGEGWLTQDNDSRDWVLEDGETFAFNGQDRIFIQALGNASVLLLEEFDARSPEPPL